MTTLGQQIEGLDMATWAALTKRAAEQAVAAAEQAGQEPLTRLVALAKMSETELIDIRRKGNWHSTPAPPTLKMRLVESEHRRRLVEQRAEGAEQDKKDAIADAAAARTEAQTSAAAVNDARGRIRATTEELLRKELQRTAEQLEMQAESDHLRNEIAHVRASEKAAQAEAKEVAAAAEAAKEREIAALDEFALQGAQLAGARRKAETALQKSQAVEEKMRAELDQVRADSAARIAAAVQHASAADQRAEERLAERAADRRETQTQIERLQGEIVKVRSDAETEIAAAHERTKAAENRALQRMSERSADRVAALETIDQLQAYLEQARNHADDEIQTAREQAVLAIATAQAATDKMLARVRAEAQRQVDEAGRARAEAETIADNYRAKAESAQARAAQELVIPVPTWAVRPSARPIENALARLQQINYILEVGMSDEVAAEIPIDAELVASLARTVQRQAPGLPQQFVELPARFSSDSQIEAALDYANAASATLRVLLRRIGSAAEQMRHRQTKADVEVLDAVARLLADPGVQVLLSESTDT